MLNNAIIDNTFNANGKKIIRRQLPTVLSEVYFERNISILNKIKTNIL